MRKAVLFFVAWLVVVNLATAAPVGPVQAVDAAPTIGATCRTEVPRVVNDGANAGKIYCCAGYSPGGSGVWQDCTASGGGSKLGTTATVCAAGCDFTTVQGALDGTTGTSTSPVTILVLPGKYAEALTVDHSDTFTSIVGFGREATIIEMPSGSSALYAVEFDYSAGDIEGFEIASLAISTAKYTSTIHTPDVSGDFRIELTVRDSYIGGPNSSDAFLFRGTSMIEPTKPPSTLRLFSNVIETPVDLIGAGNNVQVLSIGNDIRTGPADVPGSNIARCFHDLGSNGPYTESEWVSIGDRCLAYFDSPGCDPGVDGSSTNPHLGGGAIHFSVGFMRAKFVGLVAHVKSNAGASTCGPTAVVVSGSSGTPNVELVGSTITVETTDSAQRGVGVFVGGIGRAIVRDTRIEGIGPGIETDISTGPTSKSVAYLYLENVSYSSLDVNGSIVVSGLNPRVVRNMLSARDSVALPATGAVLDANSEYRLFDAAADENASWRNLRVSDSFLSTSLSAPKFRVYWTPVSATTGNVVWRVGSCTSAEDEAFPCSVSSFASVTDAVTGGAAGDLYVSAWTDLPSGSLTAGEALVVTVSRDADNGSDTMAGDAALVGVEFSYGVK